MSDVNDVEEELHEVQIRTLSDYRAQVEKALHDGEYQFTSEEQGRWLFIVMPRKMLDLERVISVVESAVPLAFRRYLGQLNLDCPPDAFAGPIPARIRCELYAVLPYEFHSVNERPYAVPHLR